MDYSEKVAELKGTIGPTQTPGQMVGLAMIAAELGELRKEVTAGLRLVAETIAQAQQDMTGDKASASALVAGTISQKLSEIIARLDTAPVLRVAAIKPGQIITPN